MLSFYRKRLSHVGILASLFLQTPPVARKIRVKADAVRVAVGKNVFRLECGIAFDSKSTNLTIRYKKGDRRLTRNLNLTSSSAEEYVTHTIRLSEDLEELKFYSQTCDDELEELDGDECEVIHFLSMRVKKKEDNGLKVLSNTYKPEGSDLERKYIVVEFRSEKEFNDVRQAMIKDVTLAAFFSEESRLTAVEARTYCKALVEDGWREKSKSLLAKSKSCFLAGKGENDVLLVYPFGADAKEIDNSASGLRELGCVLIAKPTSAASADFTKEDCDHKSKALFCDTDTAKPDSSSEKENDVEDQNDETKDDPGDESRAVLEFSVSTFERLVPGVYLNDTLIDFWCQW